jgi:hypothetical protein
MVKMVKENETFSCSYCLGTMAARTADQLRIRKTNMQRAPQVKVGPCPRCGGTGWATTDLMTKPVPRSPRPSILRKLSSWLRG